MEKIYNIEGMSCQNCRRHVENALSGVSGVESVEVSLENKNAVVKGEGFSDEAIIEAVKEAGYSVR